MARPPLPPDMVLAYKQYKQDTEIVAGWLAEKSAAAGYKPDTFTAPHDQPSKRGAKARRVPRGTTEKAQRSKTPKPIYIVKTAELVEMAKCIVKAQPKVVLSRAVQTIWERTIRARREFSGWFKSQAATDVVVDEGHSHFAFLLELALETLKPCYESAKKSRPALQTKDTNKATPLRPTTNIFQHLEVEDALSEEDLEQEGTPVITRPETKPEGPRARMEFDDREARSEFLFAIWSFMREVYAVRMYVASTWKLYVGGHIELMQAASVTNLAVDLVRRAEDDFEATLQRPPGFPASKFPTGCLPILVFQLHIPPAAQPPVRVDSDSTPVIVICGCSICDGLLYVPWAMARSYIQTLEKEPPTYPSPTNDFHAQVPPFPATILLDETRGNPIPKEKDELSQIIPNFCLLAMMVRGLFLEDEILHAARHILECHSVPIWVSLALQIQVDIQTVGKIKATSAFQDLKQTYEVIKSRADEYQKWHASIETGIWDKACREHIRMLIDDFGEWITGKNCSKSDDKEVLQRVDAGLNMKDAVRASGRVPELEDFPVTCGTMKTELHLEWHTLGLKIVNKSACVPMLCHLYNALRIVDCKAPVWPDMEFLIRNQNPEKIFIGGRPETLIQARNRFLLSVGVSVASLARDCRRVKLRKDNPGVREYEQPPIARTLFDHWMRGDPREMDEAAYQLQELLFSRKYQQSLERNLCVTIHPPAQTHPPKRVALLQTKMVRTLSRLSEGFRAEMPALMFDFFSMERRCFAVFAHLVQASPVTPKSSRQSIKPNRNPAVTPMDVALDFLNESVASEKTIRGVTSKNQAELRAQGPAMARTLKSLMPQSEDDTDHAIFQEALTLVRNGRIGEVYANHADFTENATAARIFKPIRHRIEDILRQKEGDMELLKVTKQLGTKTSGVCLFRRSSLEALYGPGKEQSWKDLVITESVIDEAMLLKADHPILYLVTILFLAHARLSCEEGDDFYRHSILGSSNIKDVGREIEHLFSSIPVKWEDLVLTDTEDWEKWKEISGGEGRLADQRRKK